MNDIEYLERVMKILTEIYWEVVDDMGKSGEPAISVGITNEGEWWLEIYSYVFNFEDGGRRHLFEGKTFEEVVEKAWRAIENEVVGELISDIKAEIEWKRGGD